ncbi:hypothetical protein GCM10025862_04750 [Arsenicicoccus piscis]|uniref:Uncharacterized protein n=1 Tax=Arsenicicoccus piscis TaxID=673954 RepID=A0ABQ6HLV4_9MICO|nr:hypothetical protein GCM10025862_04750 [Arsenicicoccus piscis]
MRVADHVDDLGPVDDDDLVLVGTGHEDVVGRQVTVRPPLTGQHEQDRAQLLVELGQHRRRRPGLGQPRCGDAVRGADELHQHLGAGQLHGIGDRQAERPEPVERRELGAGPLGRDHVLAEVGPAGHGAGLARAPHPAPLEIARVAVEHAVVRRAVALGGQDHRAVRVRGDPSPEQVDVGLLAGLEDAEVGVDGAERRDHPGWARLGAVLGTVPGGPALALGRVVRSAVDGEVG